MNSKTDKVIRNNIILSLILTILLIVTGVMPALLQLVAAAFTGDTEALASFGLAAPGLVVGFFAGILGLLVGLTPILIPVGIAYVLLKRQNREQ